MILQPLQKIVVVESTKQTKPGSIGYLICFHVIRDYYYNIVQYDVLFTKFGKSGKKRFSLGTLTTEIVDIDSFKLSDAVKGKLKHLNEKYLLPKASGLWQINSKIRPLMGGPKSLMKLEVWDFMAYISALSGFLGKTYFNDSSYSPTITYDDIMDVPTAEISPPLIGNFICSAFDMALSEKLAEYQDYFAQNPAGRECCLRQIHKQLCACRRGIDILLGRILKVNTEVQRIFLSLASQHSIKLKSSHLDN